VHVVQVVIVLGYFTGVRTLNAALTDEELAARIATLETQVRAFCGVSRLAGDCIVYNRGVPKFWTH
jgi:hypothetical protein